MSSKPDDPAQTAFDDAGRPHYHGHRERLRARFLENGPDALQDYELLELILFRVLPRRDVKALAKQLLHRFGDLTGVLTAPDHLLKEIKFVGPTVIAEFRIIHAAAKRMGKSELKKKPVLSSWTQVIEYCRTAMAFSDREAFRILFLDKRNGLIADEVQGVGTVDHTPVYPREVVKRALELSATAVILVHNHPSGDPTPSTADITMTKQIVDIAKPLGIAVHDHIIVGRDRHASFRGLRLI